MAFSLLELLKKLVEQNNTPTRGRTTSTNPTTNTRAQTYRTTTTTTKPTTTKTTTTKTYKPYTNEEITKIQAVSRMPSVVQKAYYKQNQDIAKRIAELTPKAIESNQFVSGIMNASPGGKSLISQLEALS